MTELRVENLTIPAAHLGGENPLPPLFSLRTASAGGHRASYAFEENALVEAREQSVLPNLLQDQYDRALEPRAFKVAVLENNFLRATFLLEAGGRLWSLIDKTCNKELLFRNPVFRPANLAVRDAWFSGGVEWNIALIGHTPFTCSPLFASRVMAADGTPVLRLYEWDRIRCVPWQMDFYLPEDSRFLFPRMRIINSWPRPLPMYWWSNIAVPEVPGVRVLGPAMKARRHAYNGKIVGHPLPIAEGMDVTYPGRRPYARDLYFCIPQGTRPWVTAIDAAGNGLVQTSTDLLRGRKVFNWGNGPGGRRWQEFLSLPGEAYIEIQAGLAPTQGEYVRMPAKTSWEWLEAYGAIHVDPGRAHDCDWPSATSAMGAELEAILPREKVESIFRDTRNLPDRAAETILHEGAGWGALERRRREKWGDSDATLFAPAALPFPDSTLGPDQSPWIALLDTGELPLHPPTAFPLSPMVQPEWQTLLENSLAAGKGDHWLSWYQIGVMRYADGGDGGAAQSERARQAWETSISRSPNAWAYRNLAILARAEGDLAAAASLLEKAVQLQPGLLPLALEYGKSLAAAGRHGDLAEFIRALPEALRSSPRVQLLSAQAALACGDFSAVAEFFARAIEIPTMREGEVSLSTLWFDYHEQRVAAAENLPRDAALKARIRADFPPPAGIDFRATGSDS
jgi:hypothetical protein